MERKYKILLVIIASAAFILALSETLSTAVPAGDNSKFTPALKVIPGPTGYPAIPTSPPPSPTQSQNVISPPKANTPSALPANVIQKLPYSTKDFAIEYLPVTKQLSVTIYSTDSSQAEKAVFDWLGQQGATDPESLDIVWSKNSHFLP